MKDINDEQLMIEVKNGDTDSLVPLFEKYNVKLYNFFLRVTHNKDTSEDLVQTVFSRILSYRHSYNEIYTFKTWMYQMARNVHIDYYNKNRYCVSDYKEPEETKSEARDAIEEMEKQQRQQTLKEALEQLPMDQREIIELSRFQDLKYEEISKITGNSVGAVRVKVHRAIKKLKEVYLQIA
ncbi:MAG: RNA polymerase sigma factor [Bacteroidetes bacterium]|nr:RNA polymerase sigma factor [Bacteroidota bacterium]MBL7105437.1 RNA polymerase sigma factor [Bacteroidales bacterium]